jgi:hypothetical protein
MEPAVDDIAAMDAEKLARMREEYRALRSRAGWKYRGLWLRNHAAYLGVIFGFLFLVGNSMSYVSDSGLLAMAGMSLLVAWFLVSRLQLGAYLKRWHGEEAAAKEAYSRYKDTLAQIHERAAILASQS